MDVAAIREQIPALKTCTYLDARGIGPSPAAVLTEQIRDVGPNEMAFHRESRNLSIDLRQFAG